MRRILIIDDEDDIREVAALSLEATAGWETLTANSGAKGIEVAIAEQPDAILMDVILTAKVQGVDKRRFAGLGVAAVLFKPFDPLTLAEQIAEALQWNAGPPGQTPKVPSETTYTPK
jgi:CheY-like chemotaxis protein